MKTIFIIRGFSLKKTASSNDFAELRVGLARAGFRVVPVDILWDYKTIHSFMQKFSALYHEQKGEYNIILGNSLGAVVAMATAPRLMPDELILCSLSRLFAEDLAEPHQRDLLHRLGSRRVKDLEQISADVLIGKLNTTSIKISLLYGENENNLYPLLVERVRERAAKLTHARLQELPGAGHKMREEPYTKGLIAYLSKTLNAL